MITVVGIGADGWAGLGTASRAAVASAATLMGSERQLALVPAGAVPAGRRELLPAPLHPALPGLARRDSLCLLASGDPMLHGVGASLAALLPTGALRVLPAVSSVSLAAARLGWPLADVIVTSLVTAAPETITPDLHPGARLLLLARDGRTAAAVAAVLLRQGFEASRLHVAARLGGAAEEVTSWSPLELARRDTPDLVVIGIECHPDAGSSPGDDDSGVGVGLRGHDPATRGLGRLPGLPDAVYASDGALTRREVRALVLADLRPAPGHLLWDIGAGSGSIGIEWLRAERSARAIAIEPRSERRDRIAANALTLGVPTLTVMAGTAPAALAGLPPPQAVFVGGGVTDPGVLAAAWDALAAGGRLVATAVTLESEAVLHEWAGRVGGTATRLALSRAAPLGGFTTWRPELPVVVFAAQKS